MRSGRKGIAKGAPARPVRTFEPFPEPSAHNCHPPCTCRRELDHTKLEEWQRRNDDFEDVALVEYLWHARVHVHERDKTGKLDYVWADLDTLLATAPETEIDTSELSDMVLEYEKRAAEARAAVFRQYAGQVAAAKLYDGVRCDDSDDE